MVFRITPLSHMSVYDNMAFSMKLRECPHGNRPAGLAARYPRYTKPPRPEARQLSGGQRQRSPSQAIVRRPKVFLFDEPLSNLDAKLRVQMRMEISKLHARLQATIVYVTHDQSSDDDGDLICVLKDGVVSRWQIRRLFTKSRKISSSPDHREPPMNFLSGTLESESGKLFFNEGNIKVRVPDSYKQSSRRSPSRRSSSEFVRRTSTRRSIGRRFFPVKRFGKGEVREPMGRSSISISRRRRVNWLPCRAAHSGEAG